MTHKNGNKIDTDCTSKNLFPLEFSLAKEKIQEASWNVISWEWDPTKTTLKANHKKKMERVIQEIVLVSMSEKCGNGDNLHEMFLEYHL